MIAIKQLDRNLFAMKFSEEDSCYVFFPLSLIVIIYKII